LLFLSSFGEASWVRRVWGQEIWLFTVERKKIILESCYFSRAPS
jgi:hypothetical protein